MQDVVRVLARCRHRRWSLSMAWMVPGPAVPTNESNASDVASGPASPGVRRRFGQHPPPGLPLFPELLHQDGGSRSNRCAARPRGLGGCLTPRVDPPPCDKWTRTVGVGTGKTRNLPRWPTGPSARPPVVGRGGHRLQARRTDGLRPTSRAPPTRPRGAPRAPGSRVAQASVRV